MMPAAAQVAADVQHADRAALQRLDELEPRTPDDRHLAAEQVVGSSARSRRRKLISEGRHRGPEHRQHRREAHQHEDDDRDQRQEVEPVAPRVEAPERLGSLDGDRAHAELARVDLDHDEEREVVEPGRDRRHQDHVEVGDLQELGDQERRRAQHRRRDDRAEPAGRQQPAGRVLAVAGPRQHRIGDRADGHRRRHAASPTARRAGTRPARRCGRPRVGLPPIAAKEKSMKNLPAPEILEKGAEDREQDDERGRDVDGDAEDALERHVDVADQPADVVALVGPGRGQLRAERGVGEEGQRRPPA